MNELLLIPLLIKPRFFYYVSFLAILRGCIWLSVNDITISAYAHHLRLKDQADLRIDQLTLRENDFYGNRTTVVTKTETGQSNIHERKNTQVKRKIGFF